MMVPSGDGNKSFLPFGLPCLFLYCKREKWKKILSTTHYYQKLQIHSNAPPLFPTKSYSSSLFDMNLWSREYHSDLSG